MPRLMDLFTWLRERSIYTIKLARPKLFGNQETQKYHFRGFLELSACCYGYAMEENTEIWSTANWVGWFSSLMLQENVQAVS